MKLFKLPRTHRDADRVFGYGGGEDLVERQRKWPHEAEARATLVVHALPPSGPAPVAAVVLALGTGLMQQDYLRRPPNSRTG